jgi:enamine deaminase RidA (YjgF/YER057c/UK114 family)
MGEYKGSLNSSGIKSFNSPGLGEKLSSLLHISSAVTIPANTCTVVTSGTTGYDEHMVYPKDLTEEIMNAFANVEAALAAAGVRDGFRSVYQMTSYHVTDFSDAGLEAVNKAVEKYFGKNRPAWAGVGVASLYGGARIEITAWAALQTEAWHSETLSQF